MEADSFELEQPKKRSRGLLLFVVGVALGVAVALLWPRWVSPHLPAALRPSGETVEGPVLGKTSEQDRLLLTVQAEQGAILVTFTRRVAEIDLLVDRGDTVSLGIERYEPFVENPEVRGVRKASAGGQALPTSEAARSMGGDTAAGLGSTEDALPGETPDPGEPARPDSLPSSDGATGAPQGGTQAGGG